VYSQGVICVLDDQELNTWLNEYNIFTLEATLVTAEFCAPFFKLGMAEPLQSGTTFGLLLLPE
jgi:cytosine/adenosine deaminase-related metal-dependent hydrolase